MSEINKVEENAIKLNRNNRDDLGRFCRGSNC